MMRSYWVYILCSQRNGTLYIGVTNDLARRIYEHKCQDIESFTEKYNVTLLVHTEEYPTVSDAIAREKRLKKWKRAWKINLIEKYNPEWVDLYEQMI